METVVTVYELKENEELTRVPETASEWAAMVADLGLEGQQALLTKAKEGVQASPIPYLWMNRRMRQSFAVLCPRSQPIEAYSKMPVPILILGHVKQCQMKGWFQKIEVWYDDKTPDPVVVGIVDTKKRDENLYLIGRWGAEDKSLEALFAEAAARAKVDLERRLRAKIEECTRGLATIDKQVEALLADEYSEFKYL